jgi:UDP-glucose 4-epimerase
VFLPATSSLLVKAVGESTRMPIRYYENNLIGSFVLLKLLNEFQCHRIVFSSSATVYGAAEVMPIAESATVGLGITNAYGRTKYMIEEILHDFYSSQQLESKQSPTNWSVIILRYVKTHWLKSMNNFVLSHLYFNCSYFNPVGAHPSGLIGEDPNGPPNNLMPYVAQVAVGRREYLTVFGDDYNTPDGTGVRDYLHVMDLAEGHLAAIQYQERQGAGIFTFNLGTGNGYSVLDMVHAMEKACGHKIKYVVGPRRSGDIAACYADASLAEREMGWKASRALDEMCRDLWSWQLKNPNGYAANVAP